MTTLREKIEIMQAYEKGERLQVKHKGEWSDISFPLWNWELNQYRVKPKKTTLWFALLKSKHAGNFFLTSPVEKKIHDMELEKYLSYCELFREYCETFENTGE